MLLPGQKNELFQLIEKNNLDPRNFKWESVSTSRASTTYAYGEKLPVLKYNGTDFYFSIDYKRNKYFAVFSPGYKTLNEKKRELSWDLLIRYFKMWLIYLKREIKQPDLWGELLKSKLASDASDISLEPFTEPELKKISVGVDKIRAYLGSEFKFTIEEKKKVNEQLDYLVSAAKGQGKKDWYFMCIGIVVDLGMYLSMSPEQAKTIIGFIKSFLIGIIHLLPQAQGIL